MTLADVTDHSCVTDEFPAIPAATSRAGLRPPRSSSSTWVQSSGGPLGGVQARSLLKAQRKSGFGTPERLFVNPAPPIQLRAMVAGVLMAACGATQTPPRSAAPEHVEMREVHDLQLAALPAPTDGLVQLSLWIDAGSLDATPPQLATVAAWVAAKQSDAIVRTLPHGTEFVVRCEIEQLATCVRRLAGTLGSASRGADQVPDLLGRLALTRRNANANLQRTTESTTLRALYGAGADPLGTAEEDRSISPRAVADFISQHYGTNRAFLIAHGSLDGDALERAARDAFADAPRAEANRGPASIPQQQALSEYAGTTHFGFGLAFNAPNAAWGAAKALSELNNTTALMFPVRGSWAVVGTATDQTTAELALLAGHLASPAPPGMGHDAAEQLALHWLGGHVADEERRPPKLAFAALCREECDATAVLENVQRRLAPPQNDGDGRWRLANGAQIALIAHDTVRTTAYLRFEDRASESPQPGRRAVFAESLAAACANHLDDVHPVVDATGWGLIAHGPATTPAALSRCAIHAPVNDATLDHHRAAVAARARAAPWLEWAASAVAAGAPGAISELGVSEALADPVDRNALTSRRVGNRTLLLVAGPTDSTGVLAAAPWLAGMPAGTAAPRLQLGGYATALQSANWSRDRPRVVMGWRAETGGIDAELAARAFAREASQAVAQRGGVPIWNAGGASDSQAWVAVVFELQASRLDELPALARATAQRASQSEMAVERGQARWAGAHPDALLRRLGRWGNVAPPNDNAVATRTLRQLETAAPIFVIGRPQPEPAIRRAIRPAIRNGR